MTVSDDNVIKLGAGTAWVWPLPWEGELVPDFPPQSFEVTNVELVTKPCVVVPCPPWSDDPPEAAENECELCLAGDIEHARTELCELTHTPYKNCGVECCIEKGDRR